MKKKGFLLATAATGAAAFASGASGADLPVKAPAPMVVPPAASWAGFYIGVHAGVNWAQSHNQGGYTGFTGVNRLDSTGFIGGGQIGYNWQNGNFVFGVEADGSWLSNKSTFTNTQYDVSAEHKIRWLSTVRARFGLAVGNTMAYVTGGVAFAGVKNSIDFDIFSSDGTVSQNKTRVGWAVGGGVEHMWTRNWTVALEGMFVDLGRSTATAGLNLQPGKTTRFSTQMVIGRVKLNYKW